jgi:hypothetical protein
MVASKYTNDSTLKNVHWAMCTGVFGRRDVGRIEREMLDVLDWELSISEDDLLAHHAGLLAHTQPMRSHHHRRSHRARAPSVDSSSSSSSSELSTPDTLVDEEMADVTTSIPKHHSDLMDVDIVVSESHSKKSRMSIAQSTMDLIRSFPIPHPHHKDGRSIFAPNQRAVFAS